MLKIEEVKRYMVVNTVTGGVFSKDGKPYLFEDITEAKLIIAIYDDETEANTGLDELSQALVNKLAKQRIMEYLLLQLGFICDNKEDAIELAKNALEAAKELKLTEDEIRCIKVLLNATIE